MAFSRKRIASLRAMAAVGAAVSLTSCGQLMPGGNTQQQQPPPAPATVTVTQGQDQGGDDTDTGGGQESSSPRSSSATRTSDGSGGDGGPCKTSQLDVKSYPNGSGAQGSNGNELAIRVANVSGSTCTIQGWGKVEPTGEKGAVPVKIAHNKGMPQPAEHTLEPGQGVIKGLIWNNYGGQGSCAELRGMNFVPPNNTEPISLEWNSKNKLCDNGSLEEGPLEARSDWGSVRVPGEIANS